MIKDLIKKNVYKMKFHLLTLLICSLISTMSTLVLPKILSSFLDDIIFNVNQSDLFILAMIYISIASLNILLSLLISSLSQNIGWTSINAMRKICINKFLKLKVKEFKDDSYHDMLEVFDKDFDIVFELFSKVLVQMLSSIMIIFGLFYVYFSINAYLAFIQFIFVVFAFVLLNKVNAGGYQYQKNDRESLVDINNFIGESLYAYDDIKGLNSINYLIDRLEYKFRCWLPIKIKSNKASWNFFTLTQYLQALEYGICFIIGGILWTKGLISIGLIYLFYNYSKNFLDSIFSIQNQYQKIQKIKVSISRINNILSMEEENYSLGINCDNLLFNKLSYVNVDFSYETKKIISNINCSFEKGTITGLIGKTGSGKSTLVNLLLRFYDIDKGAIYIDDIDISRLNLICLRSRISYIPQQLSLLDDNLRNNLTYYNKKIDDDFIFKTLEEINLYSWFKKKFPKGLDTILNSSYKLSSGEIQILAIIRGLLFDSKIIALDEITSQLDKETEDMVYEILYRLKNNHIIIIISHKKRTIQRCEKIIEFTNLGVKEYVENRGVFND